MQVCRVLLALLGLPVAAAFIVTQQSQTFRGRWFLDRASLKVVFQPCGTAEKWLVAVDSNVFNGSETDTVIVMGEPPKPDSTSTFPFAPPIMVLLRGDTSRAGRYGPRGEYKRQIQVHAVDSVPDAHRAKCP